ncbi:MAG: FAD-binding domain-containing protein [Haliscomenobacter sp.]
MNHSAHVRAILDTLDPKRYAKSRNYVSGAVTQLGPYVSRGVISTRAIWEYLGQRGYRFDELLGFVQQLAWRDFFQRVWQHMEGGIDTDIRRKQEGVRHSAMPAAIASGTTGIEGVDTGIQGLLSTGHLHNHLRMYTAFLSTNLAGAHWRLPAQWMYAHLLDGDWGSNALSWQWVCGTFSNKKYIANQENVNRYTSTQQRGTFLDVAYDELAIAPVPEILQRTVEAPHILPYSQCDAQALNAAGAQHGLPVWNAGILDNRLVICNYYQLNPHFQQTLPGTRLLLLEPSVFAQYPISEKAVDFMLSLAAEIPHLQVYVGEFKALQASLQGLGAVEIVYQEHPLNRHYQGREIPRDWLAPSIEGSFSSFFSYWKKVEQSLRKEYKSMPER